MDDRAALDWLSAVLSAAGAPTGQPPADVVERARAERVHLLLAAAIARAPHAPAGLCAADLERLHGETRAAVVEDVARTRELLRVVTALEDAGCQPIVFKGAALAHTHYVLPWQRPRLDSDVLVDEASRERAARTLGALGYRRPPFVSGRLVMYQEPLVRCETGGLEHVVDLHWRVANPQTVSRSLSHVLLAARAVIHELPGGRLRVPCPADALVLACVHRASHHQDARDLLWLFDIHLIAGRLSEAEWRDVAAAAHAGAVMALCGRGLGLAAERFGTPLPPQVMAALAQPPLPEPSAVFLRPDLTPAGRLRSDLGALPTADRARLLWEILVPTAGYMRSRYGSRGWLPWLYVRRAASGASKWLRPVGRSR
jgi:hypothetical protein